MRGGGEMKVGKWGGWSSEGGVGRVEKCRGGEGRVEMCRGMGRVK